MMRHVGWTIWLRAAMFALSMLVTLPVLAKVVGPKVTVMQGQLVGKADGTGGAVFLGIPFAAPPLGTLRWRAPQNVMPWHGVRSALVEPPSCPQNDYHWNSVDAHRYNENCLYLNIHTPKLDPHAHLPVLVVIHGGSNRCGSAAGTVQTNLTRQGIVVVAIQYRLGVLGFLSLPALTAEQRGSSGNYGLMDQIKALQWVHDNIARFGGDPQRVTISGESAGGQDVGLLMLAHLKHSLFAGAWESSGSPGFGQPARTLAQNEAIGTQLAAAIGVPDTLSALRAVSVSKLLAGDLKLHSKALTSDDYMWLQAVVDGRVITAPPALSLALGEVSKIPYVISSNRIELEVPGGGPQIPKRMHIAFGTDTAAAKRYYGLDGHPPLGHFDASYGPLVDRMGTDTDFRCSGNNVLRMHAATGSASWRDQVSVESSGKPSHHGADLPYLYNGLPLNRSRPSVTLQAYYANFIKTGNPNGKGLPLWPRFAAGNEVYVDFTAAGVKTGVNLGGPVCRLVNGV
ncbi:carboxylesterase/lipase family protein [Rhodanobacter sp. 115]|uniref:carboxylesterase/lipase family protein n=1 Tax=Rhodanobacter sp. FW021-MT20 TaxID=1162282 RepID=UPI0034E5E515